MAVQPAATLSDIPPFPALSDRALGTYNSKAYAFGAHMGEPGPFVDEINALSANVQGNATEAFNAAVAAAAAAVSAIAARDAAIAAAATAINAPGTQATSTTSMTLSTGTKNFTLAQTGKIFPVGSRAYAASAANLTTRRMVGIVTANDPGTGAFTLSVTNAGDVTGSGTYTDWVIANAGEGTSLPATSVSDAGKVLGVTSGGVYGLLAARGAGGVTASGSTTLTVASSGVQRITPTGPGQWIKLPDATTMSAGTGVFTLVNQGAWDMEIQDGSGAAVGFMPPGAIVGASITSIASTAGVWELQGASALGVLASEISFPLSLGATTTGRLSGAVSLDSGRELLLFAGDARLYGVVWDGVNSVFGTPVLIRSADIRSRVRAIKSATDQVLVISCNATTGLEAVAVGVVGTAITVNTAATATLAGNVSNLDDLIAVAGQGFAHIYRRSGPSVGIRAITVTGTTVAIGAESVTGGNTGTAAPLLFDYGGGKFIFIDWDSGPGLNIGVRTMVGTALTSGTSVAISTSGSGGSFMARMLASGRVAIIYEAASANCSGTIISVPATTAIASTVLLTSIGTRLPTAAHVIGSQAIVVSDNTSIFTTAVNVLTDNAGTAVAGTEIYRNQGVASGNNAIAFDAISVTTFARSDGVSATGHMQRIGISGNNPILLAARYVNAAAFADGGYTQPWSVSYGKEAIPPGVLRGSRASVAGLAVPRNFNWVTRAGMPALVPAQPAITLVGGNCKSLAGDWEWAWTLVQTGLVVAIEKVKVA